jgi:hypothetical protein
LIRASLVLFPFLPGPLEISYKVLGAAASPTFAFVSKFGLTLSHPLMGFLFHFVC